MGFYKSIYRQLWLKLLIFVYHNTVRIILPFGIRTWRILRFIWWRFVWIRILRRPPTPTFMLEKSVKRPEEFFTSNGGFAGEDLANLWYRFNFDSDLETLKRLVEIYGSKVVIRSVCSNGWSLSHWVAEGGNGTTLKYLAEVEPTIVQLWKQDTQFPMVHLALMHTNRETAESLINDFHLDVSIFDNYDLNAMMRSFYVNQLTVFYYNRTPDLLLRCFIYGIDVNQQNSEGKTALHFAVQNHALQSVRLLLWLGALLTLTDHKGCTPFDYAIERGNLQLAQLLQVQLTSWSSRKLSQFSRFQKILLYWKLIKSSSSHRWSELRYWIGVCIISLQLSFCVYILPVYFLYYLHYHTLFLLPLHLLLIGAICLTMYNGYLTVFRDAGFMPTGSKEYFGLLRYLTDPSVKTLNRAQQLDKVIEVECLRLCHICQCIAPTGSKHCYYCKRCCLNYDHHCVFLFTCIGRSNVDRFITFTFSMALIGSLGTAVVFCVAAADFRQILMTAHYHSLDGATLYFKWDFWSLLWNHMTYFHFINLMFCWKFLIVGTTLGVVTAFKKKILFKKKKKNAIFPMNDFNTEDAVLPNVV